LFVFLGDNFESQTLERQITIARKAF